MPPSLRARALLFRARDKVSDPEVKARADFYLRWKVALAIEVEDLPFAKSTVHVFRAQLIMHDNDQRLCLARETGYLKRGVGCGWRWTRRTFSEVVR